MGFSRAGSDLNLTTLGVNSKAFTNHSLQRGVVDLTLILQLGIISLSIDRKEDYGRGTEADFKSSDRETAEIL